MEQDEPASTRGDIMKTQVKILAALALLGFLWVTACKPLDLSMQRNRIFLMGRLLVGKTCDVRLIYRVGSDEATPVRVAADLSEIGGDTEQALTADDNGIWRWSGQVVPDAAGEQPVLINARDAAGQVQSSKKLFPVYNTDKAVAIGGGGGHSLAVRADGTVVAWGWFCDDSYDYDKGQCDVPSTVGDAVAVAGGEYHSIALNADGTVVAWGKYLEYMPDNTPVYRDMYVPEGLADVVAITTAHYYGYNLALKADGTVVAWGGNDCGEIALDAPADLTDVIAISAWPCVNFAVKHDGSVVSWGVPEVKIESDNTVAVSGCDGGCIAVLNEYGKADIYMPASAHDPDGLCPSIPIRAGSEFKSVIVDFYRFVGLGLRKDGTVVSWSYEYGFSPFVNEIQGDFLAIAQGGDTIKGWGYMALTAKGRVKQWNQGVSVICEPVPDELQ
jgi:hypothetical protein